VTKKGAQSSLPLREEVEEFLEAKGVTERQSSNYQAWSLDSIIRKVGENIREKGRRKKKIRD
jgi:hypothetical protein